MKSEKKEHPKNRTEEKAKKMSRTISFQPAPDVRELLIKAKSAGLELSEILNQSLRQHGVSVSREMADSLRKKLAEFDRGLQ